MGEAVGSGRPVEPPLAAAKLSLLVYNFAQVDQATLEWAASETSRILAEAGLPSEWHHCTVNPAAPHPGCEAAFGPTSVTPKNTAPRDGATPTSSGQ
jgi:hypothetical protein